jgi:hypothetical protein
MSRAALFYPNRNHLIPEHVEVPKAAREPVAQARELWDRYSTVAVSVRSLREQVENAPAADRNAARHAARAGEPVPARTEPVLRDQLHESERTLDAVQAALRDALAVQAEAMSAVRDEWVALLRSQLDAHAAKIANTVAKLTDEYTALDATVATVKAIEGFDGLAQTFDLQLTDDRHEQVARERADEQARTSRGPVLREHHALLATLAHLAEQAAAPSRAPARPAAADGDERYADTYPHGLTVGGS